jgi:hypothetical protein
MIYLLIVLAQTEAEDAAKALKATGSFEFTGRAELETPDDAFADIVAEMYSEPAELKGSADGKSARLQSKIGATRHEVFRRDRKTVERLTWSGTSESLERGADDVLSLMDLEALANVKPTKSEASKEEKVGDAECRAVRLTLPAEAIRCYHDLDEEEDLQVDHVDLKLWIGKEDGKVRKLEGTVARKLAAIDFDEEAREDQTFTLETIYTLTLKNQGKAKVEFPAEIVEGFSD